MMDRPAARLIAFYLPQFHPVPENDEWWGTGFTEWTNTAKARPLFKGHYQPHVPADLGFYDLRVPETRAAQAAMARAHGIEAFCYYHYWFAGRRLLERPFNEVLASGAPDFPFCLCWANHTWSGVWYGAPERVLVEQTYPGPADHEAHFNALLPAFRDRRYVRVDGKPVFVIFMPLELPQPQQAVEQWRQLARAAGLPGIYFIGCVHSHNPHSHSDGMDATVWTPVPPRRERNPHGLPSLYRYSEVAPRLVLPPTPGNERFPCVLPNWDNTPRSGADGVVLHDSTPEVFAAHLGAALDAIRAKPREHRLVFVKSWNEWAEGNHLEPDLKFGRRYLEAVRDALAEFGGGATAAGQTGVLSE